MGRKVSRDIFHIVDASLGVSYATFSTVAEETSFEGAWCGVVWCGTVRYGLSLLAVRELLSTETALPYIILVTPSGPQPRSGDKFLEIRVICMLMYSAVIKKKGLR